MDNIALPFRGMSKGSTEYILLIFSEFSILDSTILPQNLLYIVPSGNSKTQFLSSEINVPPLFATGNSIREYSSKAVVPCADLPLIRNRRYFVLSPINGYVQT